MNFGRRGIRNRQEYLASKSRKRLKKVMLGAGQLLLVAFIGLGVIGAALGLGVFRGVIDSAPSQTVIDVSPKGFSSFVYDAKNNQVAKLVSADSNRIPVSGDMITKNLAHAFVAIEDERFYEHKGIDAPGILRAAVIGVTTGNFSEGASTITQQLIKNNVFTSWTNETSVERIKRKLQEQYLAIELEKTMSKDTILLNYLNTINLGHGTLGVEAASQRYFDKHCDELTVSECAVLASIPQNPTQFDPIIYPEQNKQRREVVLNYMLNQGYIDNEQLAKAEEDDVYTRIQEVNIKKQVEDNKINSYFVDALQTQILKDLQDDAGKTEEEAYALLYSGGLKIYSTLDPDIQAICDRECSEDSGNFPENVKYILSYKLSVINEDGTTSNYDSNSLANWLAEQDWDADLMYSSKDNAYSDIEDFRNSVIKDPKKQKYTESVNLAPQPEISLTIEDQHNGHVLAMVGGRGDKEANRTLNRATDTLRQPGSTFKVITTYAPALDTGDYTLASSVVDEPYSYKSGVPVRNWYKGYRGLSTVRQGIVQSMNIVTVKVLSDIGPRLGYDYAEKFGISTLVDGIEINGSTFTDVNETLALGGITYGVKNIELNAAYATIANGGFYIEPKMYTEVYDHEGNLLLDSSKTASGRRVLKERTAWLLTNAMEDVVEEGTGRSADFPTTKVAGKTGTTSDENDVWFCGYTPSYTATVWAGYDNNVDLTTSEEQNLAKTIWREVMEDLPGNQEWQEFEEPDGIVRRTVCKVSGQAPFSGVCPAVTEYFDEDTEFDSENYCDYHYEEYLEMKRREEEERKRKEEEAKKKAEAEAKKNA
ncbi:MAG: PBP1A family penicillin-binding protein, partial [Lachnospiraceae bacterium]|nr:PBP1A family penicillin-binding protein [Lachnospiraceae bacterium]